MAEYIEREKIWPALNVACVPYNRATAKAIESIPAADVRPVVRGKWIKIKCRSICRDCSFRGFASWNFCPNCGADMREPPRKCTRGRRE